jgi:hypothetical protein
MTKAVKDAISEEITRELAAAQKTQDPSDGSTASLATLLADGQPHVFVANAGLTVTSAGQDCALTEGDVLSLTTPPAQDAATANLQVLASKQSECAIGAAVDVGLDDLQEMQNHLLANIDNAMAQMKDHPGQGGLPTPPAALPNLTSRPSRVRSWSSRWLRTQLPPTTRPEPPRLPAMLPFKNLHPPPSGMPDQSLSLWDSRRQT